MKRNARVVDIQSGNRVQLEFDRLSQCQRCQRGAGCGSALFATSANGESALSLWLRVDNHEQFSKGQAVVVSTDTVPTGWLGFVLISFALPLCGMIFATLIATWVTNAFDLSMGSSDLTHTSRSDELVILCSAVFGLAAGIFLWTRLPDKLSSAAEDSLCLQSARIESAIVLCNTNEIRNEYTQ